MKRHRLIRIIAVAGLIAVGVFIIYKMLFSPRKTSTTANSGAPTDANGNPLLEYIPTSTTDVGTLAYNYAAQGDAQQLIPIGQAPVVNTGPGSTDINQSTNTTGSGNTNDGGGNQIILPPPAMGGQQVVPPSSRYVVAPGNMTLPQIAAKEHTTADNLYYNANNAGVRAYINLKNPKGGASKYNTVVLPKGMPIYITGSAAVVAL